MSLYGVIQIYFFAEARLGASYLDGTTRSDLLRTLETTTDTDSLASSSK